MTIECYACGSNNVNEKKQTCNSCGYSHKLNQQ